MAVPISNVTRRQVYSPSGAGGAGPYAFTFEILANTDIAVYKDDTLLTLTTHYTVIINANGTGSATITAAGLALAPVSPTQYAIIGNRTISRSTDFTTGGDFFANTINDELDQQTIFAQQNAEAIQRSLTAPQTDPTTVDMTLPRASVRANKTLAFDSNGDPTTGEVIGDNRGNWASGTAYNKRDVVKDTSNGNIYYANTSHTSTGSQPISSNADVAKWDLLVDNASSAASATAAASSASAASTSASNASSSASAASTSANNASTSASTASTQASNASTSASNASTSATAAANSAAAAASALDSFDDRYLGTKSSDPTLDNDGNALATGALYFSTTANVMKVYDGSSWIAATSAGATSLLRYRYVATSGQTTFTGADAASATLTYTVNNIAVHRNGVTLDTSEYTASNGTSIVLAVAAGTGDIIDIIAFKSFTVSDALSAITGGTVNGAVTITGALTAQAGTVSLPAITTAGDTNTGIFFPAADTIAFAEGGVEAARINASGVFTTTNDATIQGLTVGRGAGAVATNTAVGANALNANTTGSTNVAIGNLAGFTNQTGATNTYVGNRAGVSATGSFNTFVGSGGTDGAGAAITSGAKNTIIGGYNGNQDSLDIRTASNYVVLSDGDGARQITMKEGQTLALDSAVPNAGTGITFPATQSASSDANTLDDYEEGTWTPSFGNGTFTYSSRTGRYVRIGKLVTVGGSILWATKSGTGAVTISGLPFTSDSTTYYRATGTLGYTSGISLLGVMAGWSLSGGATLFTLLNIYNTTASDPSEVVNMSGSGEVQFSLTYEA